MSAAPQDLRRAVASALALEELQTAFGGRKTTVVFPDATRPLDAEAVLDPTIAALKAVGAEVTVVIALGLHRPLASAELAMITAVTDKHGAAVYQHDPTAELVTVDEDVRTPEARRAGVGPLPARFHPMVARAEALLAVGLVEPHQYAGFSGGAKGIAVGCGAAETISALHGLAFLRSPETRIGRIRDNPFQGALWRLVRDLGPMRGLMVVPPVGRETWTAFAGPLQSTFQRAVTVASDRLFVQLDEPRSWMHVVVPPSKATNFYQASRAATYIALVPQAAIVPGGWVVLEAPCPEGLGTGTGELAFADALRRGPQGLKAVLANGTEQVAGGAQRAFVLTQALDRIRLALVGAPELPELSAFGVRQYPDVAAARAALGLKGRVAKMENVFHAVPVLSKPRA